MDRKPLGEILIEMELITLEQLQEILQEQMETGQRFGEIMLTKGIITQENLSEALAQQFDMRYVDLEDFSVEVEAKQLIPEHVARENKIIPLEIEDGELYVAMSDPLDLFAMDNIGFMVSMPVVCVLASEEGIEKLQQRTYGASEGDIDDMMEQLTETEIEARGDSDDDEGDEEDDAPVIKLAMMIITEAVKHRASDIHIEPMADRLRIRYRIDGECQEMDSPPKRLQKPLLSRFKIMSDMDIAEKRLPQDGRIKLSLLGKNIDLRVNSLPAVHGESMVLRILDRESIKGGLHDVGFSDNNYKFFKDLIGRPNGIILVTGPTGSGKTTTLYAALNELNSPDRKIITAENPVEYYLTGINQAQVDEKAGMTFAKIIRSMLRQAPNIILVGEIRDLETAEIAIEAALTGHLVFSTLHTNDAPSAITRLTDIGIKPFLVASSIQAILAQRLVRTLCGECKRPTTLSTPMIKALGLTGEDLEGRQIMEPVGCPKCNHSGFRGRHGIFEMMQMTSEIRRMAFKKEPTNKIRRAALAGGMYTLLADGARLVLNGTTTPEEILKVAKVEVD